MRGSLHNVVLESRDSYEEIADVRDKKISSIRSKKSFYAEQDTKE